MPQDLIKIINENGGKIKETFGVPVSEVKEGINSKEIVYVLPSEGLIKYQQRFSERIKSRFG